MRWFLFAILFSLALIPACSKNKALPEGWRAPTKDELKAAWRFDSKDRYTIVNGDFNADGTKKALLLDETNEKSLLPYIGIKKAGPGKYTTACGKGYGPKCKKDEPSQIEIKTEAIDFFISESSNAIIYWDSERKDFRKGW